MDDTLRVCEEDLTVKVVYIFINLARIFELYRLMTLLLVSASLSHAISFKISLFKTN